jgi:hypothetical protein
MDNKDIQDLMSKLKLSSNIIGRPSIKKVVDHIINKKGECFFFIIFSDDTIGWVCDYDTDYQKKIKEYMTFTNIISKEDRDIIQINNEVYMSIYDIEF